MYAYSLMDEQLNKKQKKTYEEQKEHTRQYNKNYMNEYYRKEDNAKKVKMCRLNSLIKKQYEIDEETQTRFKSNLHTIVRIKELMDTLDDGIVNTFLLNKHNIKIKKIISDGRGLGAKRKEADMKGKVL
jgi:hypothetical protein